MGFKVLIRRDGGVYKIRWESMTQEKYRGRKVEMIRRGWE